MATRKPRSGQSDVALDMLMSFPEGKSGLDGKDPVEQLACVSEAIDPFHGEISISRMDGIFENLSFAYPELHLPQREDEPDHRTSSNSYFWSMYDEGDCPVIWRPSLLRLPVLEGTSVIDYIGSPLLKGRKRPRGRSR